ncbi:hypothetical protein BD413DRAFT_186953 [Trametes elegans]|nr:hypothetical protein BD413DRAFT_186953 [Trametes elegans]
MRTAQCVGGCGCGWPQQPLRFLVRRLASMHEASRPHAAQPKCRELALPPDGVANSATVASGDCESAGTRAPEPGSHANPVCVLCSAYPVHCRAQTVAKRRGPEKECWPAAVRPEVAGGWAWAHGAVCLRAPDERVALVAAAQPERPCQPASAHPHRHHRFLQAICRL